MFGRSFGRGEPRGGVFRAGAKKSEERAQDQQVGPSRHPLAKTPTRRDFREARTMSPKAPRRAEHRLSRGPSRRRSLSLNRSVTRVMCVLVVKSCQTERPSNFQRALRWESARPAPSTAPRVRGVHAMVRSFPRKGTVATFLVR